MNTQVINDLTAYCDKLTEDGKELSVEWDGGGDSGQFTMLLNGEDITAWDDSPEAQILDVVMNKLDYGSFAGEFHTEGTLIYDREQKAFKGVDNYSYTEGTEEEVNISFVIPDDIWFDSVFLFVDTPEELPEVRLDITVDNGPVSDRHLELEEKLSEELSEAILHKIEDSFDGCWFELRIPKTEATKIEGGWQLTWKTFEYSYRVYTEKDVCIYLD